MQRGDLGIVLWPVALFHRAAQDLIEALSHRRIITASSHGTWAISASRGREMLSALPVLIICSDSTRRDKAAEIVRGMRMQSVSCQSLTEARALIERQKLQFILCDDDLPDCNLRTSLKVLSSATGGVPVIVLSHLADWDAYMKALGAGAFDYIACPPEPIETERILRLAVSQNLRTGPASNTAA